MFYRGMFNVYLLACAQEENERKMEDGSFKLRLDVLRKNFETVTMLSI